MQKRLKSNYPAPSKLNSQHTRTVHIDAALHKKFKGFCIDNDKTMQEVTEYLIKEAMKSQSVL